MTRSWASVIRHYSFVIFVFVFVAPSSPAPSRRLTQGDFLPERRLGLELGLVDAVAAELLADAPPRQAAMGGAAVDPPAIALEDALEVGTLDPLGQLVGDRLEGPVQVELEAE